MESIAQYAIPAALICLLIYRKIKKSIGFQKLSARKIRIRLGFFAIAAFFAFLLGCIHPTLLIGMAAGVAGGLFLALFAKRHLVVEHRGGEPFFRTNIWIESIVLALFLGRLAFRLVAAGAMTSYSPTEVPPSDPVAMLAKDPVTFAVLSFIIAYYAIYYIAVLRMPTQEATSSAPPSSPI